MRILEHHSTQRNMDIMYGEISTSSTMRPHLFFFGHLGMEQMISECGTVLLPLRISNAKFFKLDVNEIKIIRSLKEQ